jgi:hypothetical protein
MLWCIVLFDIQPSNRPSGLHQTLLRLKLLGLLERLLKQLASKFRVTVHLWESRREGRDHQPPNTWEDVQVQTSRRDPKLNKTTASASSHT